MEWIKRRPTRTVWVGGVPIGSRHPIVVQSMTSTATENVAETVNQIKALERVGCELVRVAVPSREAALAIPKIKEQVRVPLIADVHFDHRLALLARLGPSSVCPRSVLVSLLAL